MNRSPTACCAATAVILSTANALAQSSLPAQPSPDVDPATANAPSATAPPPAAMETNPGAPPPVAAAHWYDNFKLEAFVDTYFSVNYRFPKPQYPGAILGSPAGGNQFRAYDQSNGFALHWFGLDLTHAPDPVGGGLNLRMGPGAALFNAATFGGPDAASGLQYIKNAYVNWKPGGKESTVTLTVGKFNQPFGTEVPESHYNTNYTRSLLYWYAQPLFLTGLKLEWAITNQLAMSLFAVNGWNNTLDNNLGKSGAIQFTYAPSPALTVALGYIGGPEQPDVVATTTPGGVVDNPDSGSRLRHFADLIVDIRPMKEVRFLLNADYGAEKAPPGTALADGTVVESWQWYGLNLGVSYQASDVFSIGLRGEYYRDPQGFTMLTNRNTEVIDGTLTLAASPTPNLVIKLDNRIDSANRPFFQNGIDQTSKTQFTTTLGVVGTTGI
ncbi:MAG TPA: porin [Polyangiaceae bacterium]|nr:porin [Polyangiaceae bacterium]